MQCPYCETKGIVKNGRNGVGTAKYRYELLKTVCGISEE